MAMRSVVRVLLPGEDRDNSDSSVLPTGLLDPCWRALTFWPERIRQLSRSRPPQRKRAAARRARGRSSTSSGSSQVGRGGCSAACSAGPRAERREGGIERRKKWRLDGLFTYLRTPDVHGRHQ